MVTHQYVESTQSMLAQLEARFNESQAHMRQFASVWIAADLGAIGYLLTASDLHPPVAVAFLIIMIALLGSTGLAMLLILDQKVYQGLLNTAFTFGLDLERRYTDLFPVRLFIYKYTGNIPRWVRIFYILPTLLFFLMALVLFVHPSLVHAAGTADLTDIERTIAVLYGWGTIALVGIASQTRTVRQLASESGTDLATFLSEADETALKTRLGTYPSVNP